MTNLPGKMDEALDSVITAATSFFAPSPVIKAPKKKRRPASQNATPNKNLSDELDGAAEDMVDETGGLDPATTTASSSTSGLNDEQMQWFAATMGQSLTTFGHGLLKRVDEKIAEVREQADDLRSVVAVEFAEVKKDAKEMIPYA